MAMRTAAEHPEREPSRCWCCGAVEEPHRMVHLGEHPEVTLCTRCARWTAKQAGELEDQRRSGPGVVVRSSLRAARRAVVKHDLQHSRLVGGPLRWIGRWLP
jgi:hypothetical protein